MADVPPADGATSELEKRTRAQSSARLVALSAPIAWRTVSVGSIFLGHAAFLCMCGLQMESVDLHGVHVHV